MTGQGLTGDQAPSTLLAAAGRTAAQAASANAKWAKRPVIHRAALLRTPHPLDRFRLARAGPVVPAATLSIENIRLQRYDSICLHNAILRSANCDAGRKLRLVTLR